jgi:hypothetical protein
MQLSRIAVGGPFMDANTTTGAWDGIRQHKETIAACSEESETPTGVAGFTHHLVEELQNGDL